MIVGTAARPKVGEKVSGDAIVVRHEGAHTLFAVIDALGHGEAAHEAAERAVKSLHEAELTLTAVERLNLLHGALRGSRGAAVTLGVITGKQLEVVGVGNVELRARFGYVPFAPMPGIVGLTMRKPRPIKVELPLTIRLFVFSDGISRRLDVEAVDRLAADAACKTILERHGADHDDASVLCLEPGLRS